MKHIALIAILFISILTTIKAQNPRVIHVFVALCDNVNQGIVPVPAKLGNGQDPFNNLYWGALYGVKTHFKKSDQWQLLSTKKNLNKEVLERCIFKHKTENVYLVADAYNGLYIKTTIKDFLGASSGFPTDSIKVNDSYLKVGGSASLIAYVGHNGLMEFDIWSPMIEPPSYKPVIILACMSKSYFGPNLRNTGATPLIWTTGLMAPEAYTLEWALAAWIKGESTAGVRQKAAEAYHYYQKCGINGSKRLFDLKN